jgi:hypothetical protein
VRERFLRALLLAALMKKLLLGLVLLVPAPALAQVPLQIHYQGYLTSSTGVPVANGNFSVMLGSVEPLTLPPIDTARWLGVQAAPAVGDIVKVLSPGAGGFTISPNSGHSIAGVTVDVTWTPRESARPWRSVASSADGAKLVAVALSGQIYTNTVTTISGGPLASVELVHAGNGQWVIVNQQGALASP